MNMNKKEIITKYLIQFEKIAEEWFDLALEEEDPVMEQKIKA